MTGALSADGYLRLEPPNKNNSPLNASQPYRVALVAVRVLREAAAAATKDSTKLDTRTGVVLLSLQDEEDKCT